MTDHRKDWQRQTGNPGGEWCKCGHPKSEHDEYGCMWSVCQYLCKRYRRAATLSGPKEEQ